MTASLLAACGAGGPTTRPVATTTVAENTAPTASTVKTTAPPPKPASSPPPGTPALRAALDKQFAAAGPSSGGAVYDITDHVPLYSLRARVARPPASVEKIYTSVAVLDKIGASTTLQTTVDGSGYLGSGGVWRGDLYLVGGGDPTFGDATFNRIWEQGYGPTAVQMVGQLQADGIRRVTGSVIGDGALFDNRPGPPSSGFAPDLPDLGGELSALTFDHGATAKGFTPPQFAARQFARTMRAMHVSAHATQVGGVPPADPRTLATVSSPPVSAMLRLMDVPSDDLFAEMFAKQLGVRFGAGGTTAGGAQVISSVISGYGVNPTIVDGSGLSRTDHSSPEEVVKLLRVLSGTATGNQLDAALPTVGVNGTVQTIAANTVAKGRCIAKTGTLNNVTNLAGYCHSLGGKLLAFALFVDGPGNWTALQEESQMVAAIARL